MLDVIEMIEAPEALASWQNKLELLILQPTPFCNLDCRYCYLPDRNNLEVMSQIVLEQTVKQVFNANLARSRLSVVWHAGEPLVVPIEWYEDAFACIKRYNRENIVIEHHFQTNAVLISERWCDFIKRHNVNVGVSLDGPKELHDASRLDRKGRGTFERVMAGIFRLQDANIPFHLICVLSFDALKYPDEICDFFGHLGVKQVGFNIEEIEAENRSSSLQHAETEARFREFFERVIYRIETGSVLFRVREIDSVLSALRSPKFGILSGNSQNLAGHIISVNYQGNCSTWSPELLGSMHPTFGDMSVGNVFDSHFLASSTERWIAVQAEINAGISACRQQCPYFDFCLGGAPANKLGEHGRFDVTETLYCRLTQQIMVDLVVAALDRKLPPG